jgi:glycine cleavage system H protein
MIKDGLFYTKEHEWAQVDGDNAIVGITDHAQEMLGEVTFVELPEVGTDVAQNEQISVVESSKAASDVFSPLAGQITEVNDKLDTNPELINESCYQDGWICKLKIKDPKQTDNLMDAQQYELFLKEEE